MTNATTTTLGADAPMPPRFRGTPPQAIGARAVTAATTAWNTRHEGAEVFPLWALTRLRATATKLKNAGTPDEDILRLATWLPACAATYRDTFTTAHRYGLAPKLLENATFNALGLVTELEDLDTDRLREAIVRAAHQGNAQVARAYAHLTRLALKAGE